MASGPRERSSEIVQWSAPRALPFLICASTSQSPPGLGRRGSRNGKPPGSRAVCPGFQSFDQARSSLVATSPGLEAQPSR
eukprot:4519084-Amphidinium_carterae.1